jgi:CubicO group peptidase (beta-lactamase class C family)
VPLDAVPPSTRAPAEGSVPRARRRASTDPRTTWRRLERLLLAGVLLATLGACTGSAGADAPSGRMCRGSSCIDVATLVSNLRVELDGEVAGYVALVGDAAVLAGGMARRDADPPTLPMAADVMVNTASVGKMFTTAVLLKALARHRLGVDAPIGPYLPPGWVRGPNIETITFRDLLTHRSGFRLDSDRVFTSDTAAREQIAQGIHATDHGTVDYNNINFTLVRDLLPQIEPAGGSHVLIGGSADQLFIDRVQRDVFNPAGVHTARCTPPAQPMLYYPPVEKTASPGTMPPVGPSACSSGGWFITPADMLRVLRGLEQGDLLSEDLRQQMTDGCLGWDECGRDGSHWKGGAFGDSVFGSFETFFGTATGLPMVVVINSPARQASLPMLVRSAVFLSTKPR